ncbi:MAG: ABC transporter ATP-binding protein [Actinomycetota bacterium]
MARGAALRDEPRAHPIALRGVTKTYRLGDEVVRALDDVTLDIAQGEFVAICGPSGSGKSTLANIVGGLDRPDSGVVTVGGVDLSKAGDRELSAYRNRTIGFIFQSFNLQPRDTALENVMAPLVFAGVGKKERRSRAAKTLELVGLGDRIDHRPTQLSGGQRQRVAIARALANEPAILIADEPTGNLDSQRGREVIENLRGLNRQFGVTLLMITHDPAVAASAPRVLDILDGHVTDRRR